MNAFVAHYFPKNKALAPLDLKRINYTLQVNLGMFVLFAGLLLIHIICQMGAIHYTGDVVGMLGVLVSLRLIQQDKVETAQNVLIWSGIVCVCLYGPVIDWYAEASVHFLRVYVTLFAMVGILILMITFFIEKVNYTLYGLIFSGILVIHFGIIINYIGGIHAVTPEIVSYFTIAIASVNMVAFVCNTMVRFNSALIRQIRERQ